MPAQAPNVTFETIIAILSRNGQEDQCNYLDGSSCSRCQNPVAFTLCVKDAQETLDIFAEGAANVIPITAAIPMRDAAKQRLTVFSYSPASAMVKATELKKTAAAVLTAFGLPPNSVKSIEKALLTIEINGRLPVPQSQGNGIIPKIQTPAEKFSKHLNEIKARVRESFNNTSRSPTAANPANKPAQASAISGPTVPIAANKPAQASAISDPTESASDNSFARPSTMRDPAVPSADNSIESQNAMSDPAGHISNDPSAQPTGSDIETSDDEVARQNSSRTTTTNTSPSPHLSESTSSIPTTTGPNSTEGSFNESSDE